MKKLALICLVVLVVSFSAGIANAVPTTWEAEASYGQYVGWWETKSFSLDLTGDGYLPGIEITDFLLSVQLRDDSGSFFDGPELAFTKLGDEWDISSDMTNLEIGWSLAVSSGIEDNGKLDFSVSSLWGDFYVDSAKLTATGEAAPVPEPATMLLLGTGIVSIVSFRKKRLV